MATADRPQQTFGLEVLLACREHFQNISVAIMRHFFDYGNNNKVHASIFGYTIVCGSVCSQCVACVDRRKCLNGHVQSLREFCRSVTNRPYGGVVLRRFRVGQRCSCPIIYVQSSSVFFLFEMAFSRTPGIHS